MPPRLQVGPFRGLAPYLQQDADLFFGREGERAALLDAVKGEATAVLLTGEAGAGKTSLLRAGLIPSCQAAGAPRTTGRHSTSIAVHPGVRV